MSSSERVIIPPNTYYYVSYKNKIGSYLIIFYLKECNAFISFYTKVLEFWEICTLLATEIQSLKRVPGVSNLLLLRLITIRFIQIS